MSFGSFTRPSIVSCGDDAKSRSRGANTSGKGFGRVEGVRRAEERYIFREIREIRDQSRLPFLVSSMLSENTEEFTRRSTFARLCSSVVRQRQGRKAHSIRCHGGACSTTTKCRLHSLSQRWTTRCRPRVPGEEVMSHCSRGLAHLFLYWPSDEEIPGIYFVSYCIIYAAKQPSSVKNRLSSSATPALLLHLCRLGGSLRR